MNIESDMPTGVEFSQELKQLMFKVIRLVENEKNGTIIPLNNMNDRLHTMLEISLSSARRVKEEMRQNEGQVSEERQLIERERRRKENQRLEITNRLRQRQLASRGSAYFTTVDVTET